MRVCALLLLLLGSALGQSPETQSELERLKQMRERFTEPGAHALIYDAVDRLIKRADAHALRPLSSLLVETYTRETQFRSERRRIERDGAAIRERQKVLASELDFLSKKAKAGDRTAIRKIQERKEQQQKAERAFEDLFDRVRRVERLQKFTFDLRARLIVGLAKICSKQPENLREPSLRVLRQSLDVANEKQALVLVLILRDSKLVETVPHLRVISDSSKLSDAVLRQTLFALSRHNTKESQEAILAVGKRRESLTETAVHLLSVAAGRRFKTIDEAQAHFAE